MNIKSIIAITLALTTTTAFSAGAGYFYHRTNRIGCGEITSVRNVNQAPLYDQQYELTHGVNASSVDLAQIFSGFGVVTASLALATAVGVDAVRDSSKTLPGVKTPDNGVWERIKAIQIKMDNGHVLNLPVTDKDKLSFDPKYEVGRRVAVFHLKDRGSIQIGMPRSIPTSDDKVMYGFSCSQGVSAEEAETVQNLAATLVQEDKIIN